MCLHFFTWFYAQMRPLSRKWRESGTRIKNTIRSCVVLTHCSVIKWSIQQEGQMQMYVNVLQTQQNTTLNFSSEIVSYLLTWNWVTRRVTLVFIMSRHIRYKYPLTTNRHFWNIIYKIIHTVLFFNSQCVLLRGKITHQFIQCLTNSIC